MATGTFLLPGPGFGKNTIVMDLMDAKFQNIITVAKTGRGNFVCSDSPYNGSDAACINAALDHIASLGGGELKIMGGHYNCPSPLVYNQGNITISGQGDLTILDFSTIPESSDIFISISGQITTTNSLFSATANIGDLKITVADGTKFKAGNWIRIRSEARYRTWNNGGSSVFQRVGEIQQIESVSGNDLTLKERLLNSYATTDTATVDLVTLVENVKISDLKIVGPAGVSHYGISVSNAANVTIEHVLCEDAYNAALRLYNVVGASIYNNVIKRSNEDGLGYGLKVENCSRDIIGTSNHFFDCRHAFACGGDYTYGVQYNQIYIANSMSYDKHVVGMFGPHPTYTGLAAIGNICSNCGLGFFNCPENMIIGNIVSSNTVGSLLLSAFCENSIVANNRLTVTSSGEGINITSVNGGIDIHDNTIITPLNRNGITSLSQSVNLKIHDNSITSGGSGVVIKTNTGSLDSENIEIYNNTINCTGTYPGISVSTTDKNMSLIKIDNNNIKSASHGIYLDTAVGTMSKINIANNKITPSTGYCIDLDYDELNAIFSNINIENNKCYGGERGIFANGFSNLLISENSIYSATVAGISIGTHGTKYKIKNNNIYDCATPITNGIHENTQIITDNVGFNPVGIFATDMSDSGAVRINQYGYPCNVYISGGTVTSIAINGTLTGLKSGSFYLPPGGSITLVYTAAPDWVWEGL